MRVFAIAAWVLLFTSSPLFSPLASAQMSAAEKGLKIAQMSSDAAAGFIGEVAEMDMQIISSGGDPLSREMNFKTKERTEGDRLLLTVIGPADIKGTKLLTWAHKTQEDEQWLYLPAVKKVKRISAQLKSGSFMGSDFTYEDFSKKEVGKYTYKYLRDEVIDGRKTWVVERYPKEKGSGYTKETLWYDQEYKAALKNDYYDRKGELIKVAEISGYRKVMNRWWRPSKIVMANVQAKSKSIMTWKKLKLKVTHSDSIFNSENLKE